MASRMCVWHQVNEKSSQLCIYIICLVILLALGLVFYNIAVKKKS